MGKSSENLEITVIDKKNHHLFQPLLYQVAMAGLSPAEIAVPIRHILSKFTNIYVYQSSVKSINLENQEVITENYKYTYDYLILACGAVHFYFGNNEWEEYAPGLKTLEQATEIRRRVLSAFESAEIEKDKIEQQKYLTVVIVGGGPTGVELAGAIGEMSRFTLAKDFRHIDPTLARVILIEAGPRILPTFSEKLSQQATRSLEKLGVQVWTHRQVTHIDASCVQIGEEKILAKTVIWAAGVKASPLNQDLNCELDKQGRVIVEEDLSLKNHSNVFVVGDQAHIKYQGKMVPGVAPAALQQGRFVAKNLLKELKGEPRKKFQYIDKGQMATIGKRWAIAEIKKMKSHGLIAWFLWILIHIYYLTGFANRFFVCLKWTWSYLTFNRGARLIVSKKWQFYNQASKK